MKKITLALIVSFVYLSCYGDEVIIENPRVLLQADSITIEYEVMNQSTKPIFILNTKLPAITADDAVMRFDFTIHKEGMLPFGRETSLKYIAQIIAPRERVHFVFDTHIPQLPDDIFWHSDLERIQHGGQSLFLLNIGYTDDSAAVAYLQGIQVPIVVEEYDLIGINVDGTLRSVDDFSLKELRQIPSQDIITLGKLEKIISVSGEINSTN